MIRRSGPEKFFQHWCIAGISKVRVKIVFDEVKKCQQMGITGPFGLLFFPSVILFKNESTISLVIISKFFSPNSLRSWLRTNLYALTEFSLGCDLWYSRKCFIVSETCMALLLFLRLIKRNFDRTTIRYHLDIWMGI